MGKRKSKRKNTRKMRAIKKRNKKTKKIRKNKERCSPKKKHIIPKVKEFNLKKDELRIKGLKKEKSN